MELRLLFLQVQVGIAVLIILLMRVGMRKLPRVYSYMLWLVVFARLLFPVSFESRFGWMPSTAEGIQWLEENLGRIHSAAERHSADSGDGVTIGSEDHASGEKIEVSSGTDTGYMTEGVAADSHTGSGHMPEEAAEAGSNGNTDQGTKDVTGTDSNADTLGIPAHTFGYQTGNNSAKENIQQSGHKSGTSSEIDETGSDSIVHLPSEEGSVVYLQPENASVTVEPDGIRQFLSLGRSALLTLWIAGAAVILIYNGAALILVKRKIKGAEHFRDNIYFCSQVKAPFNLGMFCPKIYLPPNLEEEEREYIICHERIHIRRKDYLAKNIAFLLTAANWFNPFVWVAFYFMERDMEMSCDEKVIMVMGQDIKKQYSQLLLDFAEGKGSIAVTPITFGENSVKQRVSNVLACRTAPKWVPVWGTLILFVSAVMMFTVRSDAQEQTGCSNYMIRTVGASTEIISLNLTLEQISPDRALECWARAFTDRNGDALFRLAWDKESFRQWEMVQQRGEGRFAFGESGLWGWAYNYEIDMPPEGTAAEITFCMCTSTAEIYLLKERVGITEREGLYYVDHHSTWDNYSIETAQEYRKIYGEDTVYGEEESIYSQMASLYDNSFYRTVLRQLTDGDDQSFYNRFTSPVSAARELLHLGEGTGEVTVWDMAPATSLRSAEVDFPAWGSVAPPYWMDSLSMAGEGSRAIVSYTFAKDGSCVEIPVELKEGSRGIWGLVGGGMREIYSRVSGSNMIEHEEGKADLTYVIELSNYGIYRLGAHSGLTCLWPGDVGPEADARIYEDKLYIFVNPEYAENNSDDGTEAVFVLDLLTGELHREHLVIPENYKDIFPGVAFGIEGGFVQIHGYGITYSMPLENVNEELWNHKTFRQMTEEDKQVYGTENREYLLGNPDTPVQLSVREPECTTAFIDLDGDGVTEQVILSADPDKRGQYWGYDTYRLQVGESVLTGYGERLYNNIWAYSPDGRRIILALYEDGSSYDPYTYLFEYKNGELNALGGFPQDIRDCTMKDGVISGMMRCDMVQTDVIYADWQIGDSGKVELVPRETYEFVVKNDIELLEDLPVQNILPPHEEGIYYGINHFTVSPQTVRFLRTDSTFSWVYVEAEDGSRGWFQMDGRLVKELEKDSSEVFGNLSFAD